MTFKFHVEIAEPRLGERDALSFCSSQFPRLGFSDGLTWVGSMTQRASQVTGDKNIIKNTTPKPDHTYPSTNQVSQNLSDSSKLSVRKQERNWLFEHSIHVFMISGVFTPVSQLWNPIAWNWPLWFGQDTDSLPSVAKTHLDWRRKAIIFCMHSSPLFFNLYESQLSLSIFALVPIFCSLLNWDCSIFKSMEEEFSNGIKHLGRQNRSL